MNKYLLSAALLVSALYGLQSSVVYAMEEPKLEASQKNPSLKYKDFKELSDEQFIAKCMPNLNDEQKKSALKIFKSLSVDGLSPIKEDGIGKGLDNNGKILPEGGYSFPPTKKVQ